MYYVLFFDYSSLENMELVKRLRKSDDLNDMILLHKLDASLLKETFSTEEEARQFVHDLAVYCDFFCLVDADDNFLQQSTECEEMMEKNKAVIAALKFVKTLNNILQAANN